MALALKNVLISDAVDTCCVDLLREYGFNVTCKYKLSKEQLINEITKYDGLIVRSDTKVTADVLATCSSLKAIGRAGTGVDNIDIDAATRKGIIVLNTPGGNSISACELTCSLITCLARNVTQGCQSLKEGRWDRKMYTGSELSGKTLAILGLGRIGREVAIRMQAFGMRTVGFDPMVSADSALEFNVEKMELNQIWPVADYITVHTPLIPQTRNLINDTTLSSCKRGVKIINVARGGIVDEEALLVALKDGRCGGAALDVFLEEPPKGAVIRELIEHPHVVATPHLGASTAEAQTRVAVEIAQQFIALAQPQSGYEVNGVVNAAVLSALRNPENTPWIELAKSLGKLASKLLRSEPLPSMSIAINTQGSGLEQMKFLSTAVLVGMLSLRTSNGLNLINAPILAKDAGLKVSQGHTPGQTKSLTINVSSSSIKHSIQGRVQGDGTVQLTAVDDAQFTTGVTLASAVSLFQGNNASQNIPAVIAELTKNAVTITNIAIANGKNVWIAVQTTNEVPQLTASIPGVERY